MIYYISDTHFGHKNVIKFDQRPFKDIEEMDQTVIDNWNNIVTNDDDVYILGDFVYKSRYDAAWYLKQLNGKKHLIIGNHDKHLITNEKAMTYFESVNNLLEIQDNGNKVVLCHYPIAEWNQYYRDSYHIYGHIHNAQSESQQYMFAQQHAFNAGCMIHEYKPVTLSQMIEKSKIMKNKESHLRNLYGDTYGPKRLRDGRWLVDNGLQIEEGNVEYIAAEFVSDSFMYPYSIDGVDGHDHTFEYVMMVAIKKYDSFEIKEADEKYYSNQQLRILRKVVEKMRNKNTIERNI